MAGSTFTVLGRFGVSSGPTYTGQTSVAPGVTGNDTLLIDKVIAAGAVPQDIGSAILKADVEGFGFVATLTALNGNAGTPSITVRMVDAGAGGADLEYVLEDGEQVSFIGNDQMTGDATGLTVLPDTVSDFTLSGMIQLTK
jgi:hypothetical protein